MKASTILRELELVLCRESNKHYKGFSAPNSRNQKCSIKECLNKAYAKRLCNAHYLRARLGKSLGAPIRCRRLNGCDLCECGAVRGAQGGWYLCAKCYKRRRREILKHALVKLFGGCCSRCHREFPSYVFDFHHVGRKNNGVGNSIDNISLRRLADEVEKCLLFCANCHREETHG